MKISEFVETPCIPNTFHNDTYLPILNILFFTKGILKMFSRAREHMLRWGKCFSSVLRASSDLLHHLMSILKSKDVSSQEGDGEQGVGGNAPKGEIYFVFLRF